MCSLVCIRGYTTKTVTAPPAPIPDRTRRLVPLAIGGLGVSAVDDAAGADARIARRVFRQRTGVRHLPGQLAAAHRRRRVAGAMPFGPRPRRKPGADRATGIPWGRRRSSPLVYHRPDRHRHHPALSGRGACACCATSSSGAATAVGVGGTVLGSLALLLPFCLVSGALLTLACGLLARAGDTRGPGAGLSGRHGGRHRRRVAVHLRARAAVRPFRAAVFPRVLEPAAGRPAGLGPARLAPAGGGGRRRRRPDPARGAD